MLSALLLELTLDPVELIGVRDREESYTPEEVVLPQFCATDAYVIPFGADDAYVCGELLPLDVLLVVRGCLEE